MWPFGESALKKEWKAAEEVLRGAGVQGQVWASEALPFVFTTADGTYRLVHHSALLPMGEGMDALVAYLREIDVFTRKRLKVYELVGLLRSFGAWPTTQNPNHSSSGQLGPILERSEHAMKLVLHFFVPERQYRPGVTPPAPPPTRDVEKLTLTIDRTHPAQWTKELIQVDRSVY